MDQEVTVWAKVHHRFFGTHHWPLAKGEFEFLKHQHHHYFHVTVWVEQFDVDRDIEYLALAKWLAELCKDGSMDSKSCEQIALDVRSSVLSYVEDLSPGTERRVNVEVLEDGVNGAYVEGK
jgi:hypothetical protein